jgi:hypothetical protein
MNQTQRKQLKKFADKIESLPKPLNIETFYSNGVADKDYLPYCAVGFLAVNLGVNRRFMSAAHIDRLDVEDCVLEAPPSKAVQKKLGLTERQISKLIAINDGALNENRNEQVAKKLRQLAKKK